MYKSSQPSSRLVFAIATLLMLAACGQSDETPDVAPTLITEAGETISVMDFMLSVVEPPSDVLWASAGWINDIHTGYSELYPTTDEEWAYVAEKSILLIEAGNRLATLQQANDGGAWSSYSEGMSTAGERAKKAAEEHNEEDFFQAGALLYSVCTACHQAYNPEISQFINR